MSVTNEKSIVLDESAARQSRRRHTLLRRTGGIGVLMGAAVVGTAVLASSAVFAGGNPNFEGILSAASPTGFMSSPQSYDISGGPVTVDFNVSVTNLTSNDQTVALNFSAHHILTYNGQDVADGQPGQAGITFSGPQNTTQALMPGTQQLSPTWEPNATKQLMLTYSFDSCGYYQIDLWAPDHSGDATRDRATLASGFIRVLGCAAGGPTPTPTASVAPTNTAAPSPTAAVQAISTPGTGSGGSWIMFGAALLALGTSLLAVGVRPFRKLRR